MLTALLARRLVSSMSMLGSEEMYMLLLGWLPIMKEYVFDTIYVSVWQMYAKYNLKQSI